MKRINTFEKFSLKRISSEFKLPTYIAPDDKGLYDWDKNFKIGDTVYYFGHDFVGGFLYGHKYKADQEMVDKKENLQFYRLRKFKDKKMENINLNEKLSSEYDELINNIIDRLKEEAKSYRKPGGYQEQEWYIRCEAKAEAFEDAIEIVKYYLQNENL